MRLNGNMKCIALKEPWASAVLFHGKRHENRVWACPKEIIGTTVLLHTSITLDRDGAEYLRQHGFIITPLPLGHIVGMVDIVGCVTKADSFWFVGPNGFVLENPVAFKKPIRHRGQLKFFTVPEKIVSQLAKEHYP